MSTAARYALDNTSSNVQGQAFTLADDISLIRSYDSATCIVLI